MPSRSDRDAYADIFDDNPFEDVDPLEVYGQLQWDKHPEAVWEIEAPEPLIALGELAAIDLRDLGADAWDEHDAPFLAVGRDSNMLFSLPKDRDGAPPSHVPKFNPDDPDWTFVGCVEQTDYYSDKGDEAGYYYHRHEKPYPQLWEHKDGCQVWVPSHHEGGPSYAVGKPGIIG